MNVYAIIREIRTVMFVAIGLLSIAHSESAWAQPQNKAPRFTQYPSLINVELGDKVSSIYVAVDPDKDALTYSPVGSQLPGAKLTDVKEGVVRLEWTPTREGTFEIDVTVFDDGTPPKSITVTTKIRVVKKTGGTLSVSTTRAPADAAVGDRIEHELVVENGSPEVLESVALTLSVSSGTDFVRAHGLACDAEGNTATCVVGTLSPAGSDGDALEVTLVSQVNVASQQAVTLTVSAGDDALPLSGNVQNRWTTEVTPISTDKIQLSLFGSETITEHVPLSGLGIAVEAQYAITETNFLTTYQVFSATNLNGDVNLSLPDLNFESISTTVAFTETQNNLLPTIDFELALNNMPTTGELTATVTGREAVAICGGIQLWMVDGNGQTSGCESQSGHSWQNISGASHATITGKVTAPPRLVAAARRPVRSNPMYITIQIVALPDDKQLYLPLIAK